MGISIVIPTCGRPELLARCLRAIALQEDAGDFEVIVVDDAGTPSADYVVEEVKSLFPADTTVQCLRLKMNSGPAAARNAGWRAASHDIIAFTDDDTIPEPAWLRAGREAMKPGVLAATGKVVVPLTATPTDYELNESHLATAEFVTADCFVTKDTLNELGGFDEQFRAAWREDSDLHFRLLELAGRTGGRLMKAPLAVVVHPVRKAGWGVSLNQQRKAYYEALLFKKHPELYRENIARHCPVFYYVIIAASMVVIAALLLHSSMVAAAGALVWSFCVVRFMLRRLRHTSRRPAHVVEMIMTSVLIPYLSIYWRLRGAMAFKVWFA